MRQSASHSNLLPRKEADDIREQLQTDNSVNIDAFTTFKSLAPTNNA